MKRVLTLRLLAVSLTLLMSACATIKEAPRADFLTDYSKLELVEEKYYRYSAGTMDQYSSFIVDPVVLLIEIDEEKPEFTEEQLDEIKQYFSDKITEALSKDDGYPIVTEAGPGVARIRIAITDLDSSNGLLNLAIYTKITGAGLGGIAAEGEIVDSVSGEQQAAAIRWGTGSRVLRAGLTRLGDAKLNINRWSKNLRKELDAVNNK